MQRQIIIWQVVAAYGFAVAGGLVSAFLRLSHHALCRLISLAAGALLGVTLFAILPESVAITSWWATGLAALTGYALFFLVSKYVHHVCPACAASHFDADAAKHFSDIAIVLVVALAIHSTSDGVALGIAQESNAHEAAKWSLFLALCIHKLPEGLALGSLLIGAGFRPMRTLRWVAATEATTLLGGAIGLLFLARASTFWLGLIMAHIGGGFFYLAAHAVLGEMMKHGKQLVVTSFAAGVALIGFLNICLRMFTP
ncbi:MAG: zinc and cadmium transporter [Verrucomicrobiota bacterium]|jgi:zinc transporter ZupT